MRIMIIYATRSGSTEQVAEEMALQVRKMGGEAHVFDAALAPSPAKYDGVVIGSSIRKGEWLHEALDFIKEHRFALSSLPVAYYNCGMVIADHRLEMESERNKVLHYNDDAEALVKPIAEIDLAGKMDYSKLKLFEKLIVRMIGDGEKDARDFREIRKWMENVFEKFEEIHYQTSGNGEGDQFMPFFMGPVITAYMTYEQRGMII